ncbi:unnamed protein product [Miscanthus lutarioriparius]|uniref:DAGKc domain-containing protein n=1 Tax=Miscanthus lutarioriparius TaxID=422564 RepID=A0A811N127_9POAL|nr:unnamed protein product [Miscanthus lutarioriparius]
MAPAWYSSCNIVTCRPKRLFIIVNPYGGKGSGQSIFQNEVLPLTEAAGVLYTMQETKHRLHAQEIAHSLDLRKQTFHALQCATGTGNGMARSLLHAAGEPFCISNAGFAIIGGKPGKTRFFSVLMLTRGLVADIDIGSEKYRWMGSACLEYYVYFLP